MVVAVDCLCGLGWSSGRMGVRHMKSANRVARVGSFYRVVDSVGES